MGNAGVIGRDEELETIAAYVDANRAIPRNEVEFRFRHDALLRFRTVARLQPNHATA